MEGVGMRVFCCGAAILGLALGAPTSFATAQRMERIHPERDRMSASARRQAVLDDLTELLAGPTTATSIATSPHVASNQLCARDLISIQYRHTKAGNRKSPLKPIRISSIVQQFHLIGYSKTLSEGEASKACRSLDGTKDYWAYAANESTAGDGLWALRAVADAVRAKQGVTFDCTALEDSELKTRCAEEFLSDADHPESVTDCPERPPEERGQCFDYGFGRYRATLIRSWSDKGIPAYQVKLEAQEIIV